MNIAEKSDWTQDDVAKLIRLADGTRSAAEIARELGRVRNAVIGKLNRLRAAKKIGDDVRLLPSGNGSVGRNAKAKPDGKTTKPKKARAPGEKNRFVPANSTVKAPTFVAAEAVQRPTVSDDLPPIPMDHALTVPPMGFFAASEGKRCLFYSGDPYSPAGPDMPVCGAERPGWWRNGVPPYCVRHLGLRYVPRAPVERARVAA